jgi:hypothetical protein
VRRVLGILALLMSLSAGRATAQVLNPVTPSLLQSRSWTYAQLQTFSVGLAVASGQKVLLEGSAGDTYLMRETATGFVRVYVDGVLRATITQNGVIEGPCPSNIYTMEAGTECFEPTTGKKWRSDWQGPHEVTN